MIGFSILWKIKRTEASTSNPTVFGGSNGWLTLFLKRTNLHNVHVRGESIDEKACANYPKPFKNIIESIGYSTSFQCWRDRTFWEKKPSRTYIAKLEKQARGFKASKEN